MKKVLISMLAFTMITTSVFADAGKKGKKAKGKVVCGKGCAETKDCHKTIKCPNKPGCICN